MADVLERLKAALADRYRIERDARCSGQNAADVHSR
jgi:hypothetical protein